MPPGARSPQERPGGPDDRKPEAHTPPHNGTPVNGASGFRRPPADATFWFGDPLPEDSLPPLDKPRNGHPVPQGMLPPTPADTRYPPPAPPRPDTGAPGDRGRRGPADLGKPSVFFTPVDPPNGAPPAPFHPNGTTSARSAPTDSGAPFRPNSRATVDAGPAAFHQDNRTPAAGPPTLRRDHAGPTGPATLHRDPADVGPSALHRTPGGPVDPTAFFAPTHRGNGRPADAGPPSAFFTPVDPADHDDTGAPTGPPSAFFAPVHGNAPTDTESAFSTPDHPTEAGPPSALFTQPNAATHPDDAGPPSAFFTPPAPTEAGPPSAFFTAPDPEDPGPPSAFLTPSTPTDQPDPEDPPRWPTPADSPSLRFSPLDHRTEPVARKTPDDENTAVIPTVPRPEPADPTAYTPRRATPEPEPEPAEQDDDQPRHGKHRKHKKQPLWRELVTLVGVALLLTFLIQHFVGRVYSIPSGSMEQTLHGCPGCTGDRVFVDKMVYDFRDPLPGDVVVFQGPNSWTGEQVDATGDEDNPVVKGLQYMGSLIGIAPPDERDFVKRVIAIGGQTVECCDDKMRVMVDGKPLDEPYIYWESGGPDERQRFAPVTVPEGTLWVMGDNRANSADSRIQGGGGIRGVVPITKVIGKVRAIVLPPSRWQGVGDHNPQAPPAIAAPAWQQGLPAGLGFAAAWPVLWLGRRVKKSLTSRKAE
ncbi:hypothetical protein GCM10010171_52980 [Actinokineospora fastidiosa]|uniref:Signal peptidase I n=1 Tax=Actinokineospora fastidiosa TaxID=1816 RepID=A0A918LHS8_9PSEU|nr:hypothetical protein GCM10010171_52980 [Actinokineospora fastidiosa]